MIFNKVLFYTTTFASCEGAEHSISKRVTKMQTNKEILEKFTTGGYAW